MEQPELLEMHKTVCEQARALMKLKNNDYSGKSNVFGNLDACDVVSGGKCSTELGILVRISDKISRLINLELKRINGEGGEGTTDESFADSCEDGINYLVLAIAKRAARKQDAANGKQS